MRNVVVIIAAFIALGSFVPAMAQQQDTQASVTSAVFDSSSLIGLWSGDATIKLGGVGFRYYLTITKVEGEKVLGFTESNTMPRRNFEGTLTGNVLFFDDGTRTATLMVNGNEMAGEGRTKNYYTLKLKKEGQ